MHASKLQSQLRQKKQWTSCLMCWPIATSKPIILLGSYSAYLLEIEMVDILVLCVVVIVMETKLQCVILNTLIGTWCKSCCNW